MTLRARHVLLFSLVAFAGCRLVAKVLVLPYVLFVVVVSMIVASEGLTDQEELRAGGIRVDQHLVEFRLDSELTYAGTVEIVRTVTSSAGLADAQQASLTFDPRSQELELVSAEVVLPDGTRHQVSAEQVFTRPSAAAQGAPGFVSSVTRTVLFPQLRVGSQTRVKWEFREQGRSVLGFDYTWRPSFTLPVGLARIRIAYADDVPLRFASRGPFEIVKSEDGGERVVEATLRDYVGQVPEKAMVAPRDLCPTFVATTIAGWEEIGARFHEAVADKVEVTPEIEALAAQIAGEREGLDAARAIHRWVCGNIQYVAVYLRQMSGWVPNRSSEVLANGYGDCKDQYVLLASLLAARGIQAEAVLVNFDRGFEELPLASPLQFDHCMAYLPQFDRYSNPTDPYRDLGELEVALSGKFVVIASPEGRTARTPEGTADANRYRIEQEVAIGADGRVGGRAVLEFTGRPAGRFRRTLALAATTEQAADDLLLATPLGGTGGLRTTDPSDLDVPLRCEGDWTSDVPLGTGPRIHFTTPTGLDLVNPALLVQFLSASERRYPTLIAALSVASRQRVELPPGYAFVALPEGRLTQTAAGRFESRYRVEDGALVVERTLRIEEDRYPPEQYAALREILIAMSTDLQAIVTAELEL